MGLNGWQRIGIVLSVLWALLLATAGLTGSQFIEAIPGQDVSAPPVMPARCTQVDPEPPAKPEAEGKRHSIFDELMQGGHHDAQGRYCTDAHFIPSESARVVRTPDQHHFLWIKWLFYTFGPIVAVWLLAYVLVRCFRWVAAGFRSKGI